MPSVYRCRASECPGHASPSEVCSVVAERPLVVGLNLPWSFAYCGYDFGPPPKGWRRQHPSPRDFETELGPALREAHEAGVRVVRFFVFADGVSLPADGAPLDPSVADDLKRLLDLCARIGLRAIPSLISFEAFFPPKRTRDGVRKRGLAEALLGHGAHGQAAAVDAFLVRTLEPLLRIPGPSGEPVHPAVLAWEAINEPNWAVDKWHVHGPAMSSFIHRAVDRIVAAGHVATVGFVRSAVPWLRPATEARLLSLAAQGRYLHQIHHYPRPDGPMLPPVSASRFGDATIVGEMASSDAPSARWPERALRATEADPRGYLVERLEYVEARGYRLALLWSRNAADEKSGFDARVRAQVARFVAGRGAP